MTTEVSYIHSADWLNCRLSKLSLSINTHPQVSEVWASVYPSSGCDCLARDLYKYKMLLEHPDILNSCICPKRAALLSSQSSISVQNLLNSSTMNTFNFGLLEDLSKFASWFLNMLFQYQWNSTKINCVEVIKLYLHL